MSKTVKGTNNKLVTELVYKISCTTKNFGLRYLEACPNDNVVKALPESSSPNQLWFIVPHDGFYRIKCLTSNGGLRCLEAFPIAGSIRPSEPSKDTDQLWTIESHESLFKISCVTRNGGMRCIEAPSSGNNVKPRSKSANVDQLWMFTPANYKLKVEINNFRYDDLINKLDTVAKKRQEAVVWDLTNQSFTETETYHPEITKEFANHFTWSFVTTEETKCLSKLDTTVTANIFGLKLNLNKKNDPEKNHSLNEPIKEIDKTSVTMKCDTSVPPRKRSKYVLLWHLLDVDVPFKADIRITALADQVKDYSIVEMEKVDSKGISALLNYSGCKINAKRVEENTVISKISGVVNIVRTTKAEIVKSETSI